MPEASTVATVESLVVHVPPATASSRFTVSLSHTALPPVIVPAAGNGFTVNGVVALQPVDNVYVIFTLPADTPVTTPEPEPTVAIAVLLLLHVPPPPSLSVVVAPTHTFVVPDMEDGNGFTVSLLVVLQPVGNV
jgi:hypothetical protein